MLCKPSKGETAYEILLYNKVVRSLVKENQSHEVFEDRWADRQKHNVIARDENEARRIVAERFKSVDGFVIEAVLSMAL